MRRRGDVHDQILVAWVEAQHARYLDGIERMFAAVDAGDDKRVLAIDGGETEPAFAAIETQVNAAADARHAQALAALRALRSTEAMVLVATPIAFTAGLGLLALFWAIVVGYQRRTERQAAENQHQALHDGLTGLPNQTLLRDRTSQAIRQADRELTPAALLLIDLDRFKEINDTLGHHYGDHLLIQVGQRLQAVLREVDTVARLGGDEFAVLLPKIATAEGAVVVAKKLQAALQDPFTIDDLTLDVEASNSCGVAGPGPGPLLPQATAVLVPAWGPDTVARRCATPAVFPNAAASLSAVVSAAACDRFRVRPTGRLRRCWVSTMLAEPRPVSGRRCPPRTPGRPSQPRRSATTYRSRPGPATHHPRPGTPMKRTSHRPGQDPGRSAALDRPA